MSEPAARPSSTVNLEYYDRLSPGVEDYWRRMAAPRHRRRVILDRLAAGGHRSAVDLGCGGGQLLLEIHRRLPQLELAGIDLSEHQIEANRATMGWIDWHAFDLDLALPESAPPLGRYDAVIASEVIEHVSNPHTFLENARRLVDGGGGVLYLTTQSGPIGETERRVGHTRHFSTLDLRRLLVATGWQPVAIWNTGFPFHNLAKWVANLRPDATMNRFGGQRYGVLERLVCFAVRCAFLLNSRRRGPQLFAVARRPPEGGQEQDAPAWDKAPDYWTARAFAESWNRAVRGSVYTHEQFVDWFKPFDLSTLAGKDVLELGFGNGSLLYHMGQYRPRRLCGVELGDTLAETRRNLAHLQDISIELHQADLTAVDLGQFDFVYCIGVIHHLDSPRAGFEAVLRHTRPGGSFHCWVYACEGNALVIHLIDPIRRVSSRLPWWVTKYLLAAPLVVPFFFYAKLLRHVDRLGLLPETARTRLPLGDYGLWISTRSWPFFHHVAFDQLVTPQTVYISRETVDQWLQHPAVEPGSTYVVFRNGNSWEFGGSRRADPV